MAVRLRRRSVAGGIALATILIGGAVLAAQGLAPAGATPVAWHTLDPHGATPGTDEPDLAEGIASFDTGGNTYDVGYAVDDAGDVRLRGIAQADEASAVDVGALLVALFTLPCPPSKNVVTHVAVMANGSTSVSASPALVQISSTGEVSAIVDPSLVSAGTISGIIPLDGIRYEPASSCTP